MVFYFSSGVCRPGTNVITSAFIWPHKNKWVMKDAETDAWEFCLYYNIVMKGPNRYNSVARWKILSMRLWGERGQFITSQHHREDFTGPDLAEHGGIDNSCLSPDQAGTSCRLILEQITNYRWYQLTSARRLTAWLLKHPSRWFDMLYSSPKLDCALDGQFPLLGQTWGSFLSLSLCQLSWFAQSFCDIEQSEV